MVQCTFFSSVYTINSAINFKLLTIYYDVFCAARHQSILLEENDSGQRVSLRRKRQSFDRYIDQRTCVKIPPFPAETQGKCSAQSLWYCNIQSDRINSVANKRFRYTCHGL